MAAATLTSETTETTETIFHAVKTFDPFLDMGEQSWSGTAAEMANSMRDDIDYASMLAGSETPATLTVNTDTDGNYYMVWHYYDGGIQIDTVTITEATAEQTADYHAERARLTAWREANTVNCTAVN